MRLFMDEEILMLGDYQYQINNDTVEIVNYNGENSIVEIPTEIDGRKVTKIRDEAFSYNEVITKVVIPEGITTIGGSAFVSCENLTEAVIPNSAVDFDAFPMRFCIKLKNICIAADHPSLKVVNGAVLSKDGKRLLFYLPTSSQQSYKIPDGIEKVDQDAILPFYQLDEITLPKSFKEESLNIFDEVYGWKNIYVAADHPTMESIDGVLFSKNDHQLLKYPVGRENTEYAIPEGTLGIAAHALDGACFEKVTIPQSVSRIGEKAFHECDSLMEVDIPVGVLCIEKGTFSECCSLQKVILHDGLKCIASDAFRGCSDLHEIVIPDSVTEIEAGAFDFCARLESIKLSLHLKQFNRICTSCYSLKKLEIPEGITEIPEGTFHECEALEEVILPNSLQRIGKEAFSGCAKLKRITIPENVTRLEVGLFSFCFELEEVNVRGKISEIGAGVFDRCMKLRKIEIPQGTEKIQDFTFFVCESLKEIKIPEGVTEIGEGAFSYNIGLQEVVLPKSLKALGKGAFFGCGHITKVVVPDGLEEIGENAFGSCFCLKNLEISPNHPHFEVKDGALFAKKDHRLIQYLSGSTNSHYEIPQGVKIGSNAFSGCQNLTSVVIPEGSTELGSKMFENCRNLESVTVPASLISMKGDPFQRCGKLKEVKTSGDHPRFEVKDGMLFSLEDDRLIHYSAGNMETCCEIPEGTKKIQSYAFFECKTLKKVIIPASVTSIDFDAFRECDDDIEWVTQPDTEGERFAKAYSGEEDWNILNSYNANPKSYVIKSGMRVIGVFSNDSETEE